MSHTNHRFTLDAFRRYEPFLVQYQGVFPKSLEIDPTPFAVETVACRIRDCVRALYANPTWWTGLDRVKFQDIWNQTQTIRDFVANKVILRPKVLAFEGKEVDEITRGKLAKQELVEAQQRGLVIENPSMNVVRAVLVLHDEGHLIAGTTFSMLDEEAQEYLKLQNEAETREFFNVGISLRDDVCIIT